MPKYLPKCTWTTANRAMDATCNDCAWKQFQASVASVRAHLAAHSTHTVMVASTVVTMVSRITAPELEVADV
jgi:hypothetical protein